MEPKTTILILLLLSIISFLSLPCSAINPSTITAIYGFGDSTMDTGNNNDIPVTTYHADFEPYGMNFPLKKPTGRFSDGRLPIDFVAHILGIKDYVPAYKKLASDLELLTGAVFASAGSGLDPLTSQLASVLSLPDQIDSFEEALQRIVNLVGEEKANYTVQNALFVIYTGTSDLINFYNAGIRSAQFNISDYQDYLLVQLEASIQRLYNLGGRKFVVKSAEPIGCLPIQITIAGRPDNDRSCIENQNTDSVLYNEKLQTLISRLRIELLNADILYFDVYYSFLDVINNPVKYGFGIAAKGCCGTGRYEYGVTCRDPIDTCEDPNLYVFWDAIHPTQAVYSIEGTLFVQLLNTNPLAAV